MSFLSILGVISSAIFSGTSLLYATLGETIHQRSGIVNLGSGRGDAGQRIFRVCSYCDYRKSISGCSGCHACWWDDEYDFGLSGCHPPSKPVSQWFGIDVLWVWVECLDRQIICGMQNQCLAQDSLTGIIKSANNLYASLFKFDILIYPGHPCSSSDLVAALQNTLGLGAAGGG